MSDGLRVVLYAEGAGETAGPVTLLPEVGSPLAEDMLGPGHLLLRRVLCAERGIDAGAVRFDVPQRTRRGRFPHGSDLLDETTLRQLTTWPKPIQRPDLVLVLTDADGDNQIESRLDVLSRSLANVFVPAVPRPEFEAWLLADPAALRGLLGHVPVPDTPEDLPPRAAKALLRDWFHSATETVPPGRARDDRRRALRRDLAIRADIDAIAHRCRSFAALRRALRP
jgi:hypothetical protein